MNDMSSTERSDGPRLTAVRGHSALKKVLGLGGDYLSGQRNDNIVKARIAIATVFSAALAGLAAGYASTYVLPMPGPVFIGVGWSILITNIDTMIVAMLGDRAGAARWAALGPRLPIVVLSGVVFVELLTLRIFQPEVAAHIRQQHEQRVAEERDAIEARHSATMRGENKTVSAEVAHHEKALADLQSQLTNADERTRKAGQQAVQAARDRRLYYNRDGGYYVDSSHWHAAQAEEQRLVSESEKLRDELKPELARHRDEIARLQSEQALEQARIDKRRQDDLASLESTPPASGLIAQLIAFEEICSTNASAWWARMLLALLLMGIELVPSLAKLGERSERALIHEKMYSALQETLEDDRLRERMALWMGTGVHRYVDRYVKNVDAAMGVSSDVPLSQPEGPVQQTHSNGADDRVWHIIRNRVQTDPGQTGTKTNGEYHV
jgi:hypothetical protein